MAKRSEQLYNVQLNGKELDVVLDALQGAALTDYRREIMTVIQKLNTPQQIAPVQPLRYYPEAKNT